MPAGRRDLFMGEGFPSASGNVRTMRKTIVIGAGVIGLLSAYELRRRGDHVTIYDRGDPGAACSAGNAGWIVPSFSGPLPAPGLVTDTLRSMTNPESPMRVRPQVTLDLIRWLWMFWRRCNARDYRAGCDAVAAMNRRTMVLYDTLRMDGVEFEMHRTGVLFVFLDGASRDHHRADLALLLSHGYPPPRELTGAEVRDLEPGIAPGVIGGLLFDDERHVRPETLSAGLLARLSELGVEIRPRVEVTGVRRRGRHEVSAVVTDDGETEADRVLVAAGAWSGPLARRLGFRLPILAGKGYSITVTGPGLRLGRAVHLSEAKVACSPYRGALRVAGTVEITSPDPAVDRRRVAAVRRAATRYLPGWDRGQGAVEWMGMRPFLPDGLPAIGRAPGYDNLYVAAGHGMLGITLGPVTGAAIADLMCSGRSDVDLTPFDPARFARRTPARPDRT
jgi:D-amino-acid dehydrogenase